MTAASTTADKSLLGRIRDVADERVSYGYRRVAAVLNRAQGQARVNHKRVYRVMRDNDLLLERCGGRQRGRVHDGTIMTPVSNLRWWSDAFSIRCWNGEVVDVAFGLDCHDREILAYTAVVGHLQGLNIRDLALASVQSRFGDQARGGPALVEWLTDNGSIFLVVLHIGAR